MSRGESATVAVSGWLILGLAVVRRDQRARGTGRFIGRLSMLRGDTTTVEVDVSSAVFTTPDGEPRTVVVFARRCRLSCTGRPSARHRTRRFQPGGVRSTRRGACRRAARDHLVLGLVYVRAGNPSGTRATPHAESLRAVAAALNAESRLGEVVGQVARDHSAMIVSADDTDGLSATIRLLAAACGCDQRAVPDTEPLTRRVHDDRGAYLGLTIRSGPTRRCPQDGRTREVRRCPERRASTRLSFRMLRRPTALVRIALETCGQNSIRQNGNLKVLRLLAARCSYQEIALLIVHFDQHREDPCIAHLHEARREQPHASGRTSHGDGTVTRLLLFGARPPHPMHSSSLATREKQSVDFGRITLVAEALEVRS